MKSKRRLWVISKQLYSVEFVFFGNKRIQVALYKILDNQEQEREFLTRREVICVRVLFRSLQHPQ